MRVTKNKKGFTFVELIAVVALMAILAVVIGGLLTSATSAYSREKEIASAKDIATIIQNEVGRLIETSKSIYLEDGLIPSATNSDVSYQGSANNKTFIMSNAPEKAETGSVSQHFTSGEITYGAKKLTSGYLNYSANNVDHSEYFSSSDYEKLAFYGKYTISLGFMPVYDSVNKIVAISVICDVYNAKNELKFDSPGKVFNLQKASTVSNIIKCYKMGGRAEDNIVASSIKPSGTYYEGEYINKINDEYATKAAAGKSFSDIYFYN